MKNDRYLPTTRPGAVLPTLIAAIVENITEGTKDPQDSKPNPPASVDKLEITPDTQNPTEAKKQADLSTPPNKPGPSA
jgi:hypothetical protein